jgi:1,4-dihydroxy-2-naphthoate octaprenyltransferase
MIVAFALAAATGVYLVSIGGLPILAIGIVSILSGIAYTGGPFPLGYNGLGDLFVFVFFGLVAVTGTTFVATDTVPLLAWLAAVPVGALATAVLVVNNVRDHGTDVHAGKRTLVVRFGRRFGEIEYAALVALAYAAPAAIVAAGLASVWALAPVLTAPWGLSLYGRVRQRTGAALNPCLADTAKLMLATSLLLSAGIALGR